MKYRYTQNRLDGQKSTKPLIWAPKQTKTAYIQDSARSDGPQTLATKFELTVTL